MSILESKKITGFLLFAALMLSAPITMVVW